MATYYLDPSSGSDSNPGTEGSPWDTIAKVILSSSVGDTIVIRNMDSTITSVDWPNRIYNATTISQFDITWTFDKQLSRIAV